LETPATRATSLMVTRSRAWAGASVMGSPYDCCDSDETGFNTAKLRQFVNLPLVGNVETNMIFEVR